MATQPAQGSNASQSSANTITAAEVFSPAMIGQTWIFTNDLGDNTFIKILSPPANNSLSPDCVIFQYAKNRPRAYWEPGSGGAALQFILCPRTDGAWLSAGSLMHGDTDLVGNPAPWISTANVGIVPGKPDGYLIIPASGTDQGKSQLITEFRNYNLAGVETFDFITSDPHTTVRDVTWRTDAYITRTCVPYQDWCGNALISEQWENCDTTWNGPQGRVHERWYFAPHIGLVQVDVLNAGYGEGVDFCTLDFGIPQCYTLQQVSFRLQRKLQDRKPPRILDSF